MWKAAFTGRSEKGDKDRDTASVSGRSEARRKKSSRSVRGDVDDTASVMSGSSRRHRSSRHDTSSRYGDDEDRDRMKDSSYYSSPPSVYDSVATYASPGSSAYATAPTSRVGEPGTRPLTASALRMLPDDDDEDWEDDEKTVRSERRRSTKKRSPSSERDRRRKSSGKTAEKEKERKRSSSRERKERKATSNSEEAKGKSRRGEPELVTEGSRAIPAMGSFEQFPGQYGGGVMGQHSDYTMSGALPNAVPQSQFPGQDYTAPYEQAAPPHVGITRADSYGHAAEYYLDEGQSVALQPGNRASTPNMLVNPNSHLIAASSVANPAQDTGNGSAADFYNDATSFSAPVTPAKPTVRPGKQSSFSASKPSKASSKPSKPSQTSSAGAVAAGLAGVAGASALSKIGKNGKTSHHYSQSEQTTSKPLQQTASLRNEYPPTLPAMNSQQRPSRHVSDGNVYYAPPTQTGTATGTSNLTSSAYGTSYAASSAYGPSYENTYGTGNIPGLYAAGAAAAGAAAYGIHQHHQHGRTDSNMAIAGDFGGNGQGPPRPPQPTGYGGYYPSNGSHAGSMMQQGHFHEHKGPMTKLKDGLLNLISTPEDVAKMEMYTEYIGVCKHCFDPRTSAWDAPRVHHYHKRKDSFESLRRRASRDKLRRKGSYERVDKESRYYASDSSRRRREERHSGIGLAGAGLAAVGTGLAANALFNDRKNFDDTYSVKSGHRESSAVRRQSRSSSRERRRRSQHGIIRPGHDDFANVTIRRKDGTVEHRRVARSRSGSGDRKSGFGLGTAAAAGAALGAAGLAASARRRSRSSSRERRRRSTRVSPGRSEYSRHERNDRRQSEEGGGGIFGNFFSPPRKQRRSSREHQKKRGGFFTFSNGSSSSSNSELAFGGSFVSRNGSKTSLSRKSSGRSTRGRPQRKSSDQHLAATLAGIGATAAALGAAKAGHRISKRTSRPELGARRHVKQHVVGDHRHGSPGSSAEDGWEDELPSDDASSADGLAFGDYGGRRLSGRQSLESVASASSAGGLGAWGWRWGGKDQKRKSRRSTSGGLPHPNSEHGSSIGPVGAGIAAGALGAAAGSVFDSSRPDLDRPVYLDDTGRPLPSVDARSSTSVVSSQPMQYVDPKPVSEAGTPRHQSIPGAFETPSRVQPMPGAFGPDDAPIYRPGPGVVQHPQPMSPARPAFTQPGAEHGFTATAGPYDDRPIPRRTQSSPVQSSWGQDAALIGAGVLGAGAIVAGSALSSGRKSRDSASNVRFGLTEEQERKESRSKRRKEQEADEERRRSDRTRALKEEAERVAKESREQEVLRAREAENQARAQAKLDLQREQERKESEEARLRAEQRAREERERQWEIERLEKEAVDRQAAAAAATAEFERQRRAREEAERHQAEVEKQNRERDQALRQQYQLAEDARREDEKRRQWEAERYAKEYQESSKKVSTRDSTASVSARSRRESDATRKQSSGWGTVAAGAAAAAGVGAVMAGREEKKRRQSGKSDSTDDTPVSRRAPRTSVDRNADAHAADREAAEQAELDRQVREQYGHASRGSVEMKNGYAATEIKPGNAEHGEPIMDDDIFDPDFFMRSQHTPAERARREELARKAADKVVADSSRAYSPDSRPKESYADFFADEIKDVLAKKPGEKERSIQPDSDVQVYHVEEDGIHPPFTLRNDFGGKSKHAPYGVPLLNVIAPTPPPGSRMGSVKGSVPSSPLSKAVDAGAERDESPESSKDSGKSDRSRSISWGEDKTHIYDVQTPESYQEKDRDSYITSPDIRGVGAGIAAAAGAAVAGAALHDIVVEDGERTTSYKDDDFSTLTSSKKSKKDKKKAKKGSKSHSDDADSSFLDDLSNKDKSTSSFQDVPSERGIEVPYKENEFSRTRKDNERDRKQVETFAETSRMPSAAMPETLPHPLYQQPFFDSVSDFSGFRPMDSPGTEGAPPVRGFVEGETEEPTPAEEARPHIPGGFDDDEEIYRARPAKNDQSDVKSTSTSRKDLETDESAWQPPPSKKEKKKREKEAKRAGSGQFDISEPFTPVAEAEAEVVTEPVWEPPLSAKEKKKRDKEAKRASSSTFDVERAVVPAEPAESAWEAPLSAKEQKRRDKEAKSSSGAVDIEPSTPAAEREADVDVWEPPLSAKERKKREKAAKRAGIDPAYSEEPSPVVESPRSAEEDADEYFPSSSSKKVKKKKAKQFDEGLERIASTTSAVSMPSWSGDTVVSDVTAKPPSPELARAEQRDSEKGAKKAPGFSFADVTDTILASGGVAAAAAAMNDSTEDSGSGSLSKKDKKRKKKSKLGEPAYDDPRDEPSGMPGGWDSPERKSSGDEHPLESAREVNVDPFDDQSRNDASSTSMPAAPEPTPVQESDPWSEWAEPVSNKKSKKKSKRSSVAFDNIPQVSSPLRSEIAWDDYVGANGANGYSKAESEAARSDPITVIERKSSDEGKGFRKASKDDDFYDAGQRVSQSPREMSPEDARSVASSADADRESRRKSRRDEARRGSDYYVQPEYAYETQSVAASEPADEGGRRKHKRRSKHEDDDTMSVSSSRRRSRHADDDDDTRSVTSSRSRRDKEESPSVKKEKKGIFGSLFSRKSTDALPLSKEAARDSKRDDDDEDRQRRKKKHRDSEYGDDDDDTRSVKSESHRRRHRSSDDKHEDDSRERRRRSTHDDDDKYSESGSRHHRRRKTDEDGESLSRHQSRESRGENGERPKHHRRRTDEDKYDSRDQSFLGSRVEELPPLPASRPGSPDQAVERMEGRPLEAGFGTGLVSAAAAAAGLAAGVAVNALASDKKDQKKSKREKRRESSPVRVPDDVVRDGPLPSAAAHSFPLPYAPDTSQSRSVAEREESSPQADPAPVLEKPSRPVSIGRPGSSTTVPLRLPGHAPSTPGGKERTKSFSSPSTTAPTGSTLSSPATPSSGKSRQGRPHSSDLKSGIMPLYLVERSRPIQEVEDSLPSLPSSKPSSRASSVQGSDEYESAREELSAANSPERSRSRSLTLDTIGANEYRGDGDILDSQQTTPKASEWPQTAIPWAFPSEKKEKQEPQFYTWEDFARDERMHEQQDERGPAMHDEPSEVDARARSKSPSRAKALAAAAMLGSAAVYAAHKVQDRSPERVLPDVHDEPLPSSAAHSYPVPYVPEPVRAANVSREIQDTSPPRELEQAFEPAVSSKKSKKKAKKAKKLQAWEEDNFEEPVAAFPDQQASSEATVKDQTQQDTISRELSGGDAAADMAWPSAAAHTSQLVPSIDFTAPSPEKEEVKQAPLLGSKQDEDVGYFASTAAHSMPVYEPQNFDREPTEENRPAAAYKLPELKSEPAPLVVEQRNVQMGHSEIADAEPVPKLTRKQSKKDKKKSKRISIFEDEPQSQADLAVAEQPVSASEPLAGIDSDVKDIAGPQVNFGLSDFGAVAAGAASVWGLSQADAFRTSMQKAETIGSSENSREPAVHSKDDFEPLVSRKQSKKDKKKAKKSLAWDEDEAPSNEQQPAEMSKDEPSTESMQVPQSQPLDDSAVHNDSLQDQEAVKSEVDEWATPSSSSMKKSKKDKKKKAASWTEPEFESAPPVVVEEQKSVEKLTDVPDVLKPAGVEASVPTEDDNAAVESSSGSIPPAAETVEGTFSDVPAKKSKQSKKQKKTFSWDDLDQESNTNAETSDMAIQEASREPVDSEAQVQDTIVDLPAKQELPTEDTAQDTTLNADVEMTVTSIEGFQPTSSKKKSKKEKRKSKAFSWDEPELKVEEESSQKTTEAAQAEPDVSETVTSVPQGETEQLADTSSTTATEDLSSEHVAAVDSQQSSLPAVEPRSVEDDFSSPVSKKQSKKDKKKKNALSWDALPEGDESVAPGEQLLSEGISTKPEAAIEPVKSAKENLPAVATDLADAALEGVNIGTEETSTPDNVEEPIADDSWAAPVSKKKSKKDRKQKSAFEWDEPSSRDEKAVESGTSTVQDSQTDAQPSVEPVEEEKPSVSRKQSKKDKKKQKSLSWEAEDKPKAGDAAAETVRVTAETTDAAIVRASETIHEAEREAVDEVPQPTATPDDSFHDAEDFFDAPADADPWQDAEETTVKESPLTDADAVPAAEVNNDSSPPDQDQSQASVKESWAGIMEDDMQGPVHALDTSAEQSNLVDDVFGIASGTGELSATLSNDAGDREEIMADRGMEFEPERASEDMDAFGDPTPRDPAEWSLGSAKKSGKKGKKGRKSISKTATKVEPTSSSSETTKQKDSEPTTMDTTREGQPQATEPEPSHQEVSGRSAEKPMVDHADTTPAPKNASAQVTEVPEVIKDAETLVLAPEESATADGKQIENQSSVTVHPEEVTSTSDALQTPAEDTKDDVDEFTWAPTSKKKKGMKGRKAVETSTPVATEDNETSEGLDSIKDEAEKPVELTTEAAPAREEESHEAVEDGTLREIPGATVPNEQIPAAVIEEPEDFTWAPVSKKDKKKAKKGKKSGAQTPQILEKPASQEQSLDDNDIRQSKETGDSHATDDRDLALAADEPDVKPAAGELDTAGDQDVIASAQHDSTVGALGDEDVKDVGAVDDSRADVTTSPPLEDKTATSVESTGVDSALEQTIGADQPENQQTMKVPMQEDEISWAPASKKGKRSKKAGKSVTEVPSVTTEETAGESAEQIRERETATSQLPALAIGGAAVAAGLLATSHSDDTPDGEQSTPTDTATDDFAWSSSTKKKGKKGKRSSKLPPEITAADIEPEAEISTSLQDESVNIPTGLDTSENTSVLQAPTAADAEDEWAMPSSKKKKGKKNRQSTQLDPLPAANSEEVLHGQQGTTHDPAETVAHDAEDKESAQTFVQTTHGSLEAHKGQDSVENKAESTPAQLERAESFDDATASQEVEQQEASSTADNTLAEHAVTDFEATQEHAGETDRRSATDADVAAIIEPESQPSANEPDEWSMTTTSKKKKGKKSKKLGIVTPPVEQEAESGPLDVETEINAEPSTERVEETTEMTADDAVADDLWEFSSSKKKKSKGKKAAIDLTTEFEPTATMADHGSADPADTARPYTETVVPATAAAPTTNEDDFTNFTSSKKKKGNKNRLSGFFADTDVTPATMQATTVDEQGEVGPATATLVEAANDEQDLWATPSSKKKAKGKKGKKGKASTMEGSAPDTQFEQAVPVESSRGDETAAQLDADLFENATTADQRSMPDDKDSHNISHESNDLEKVAAVSHNDAEPQAAVIHADSDSTPAAHDLDVATSSAEAQGNLDQQVDNIDASKEPAQADDDWFSPQMSKMAKKKSKKDKLASVDTTEAVRNDGSSTDPAIQDSAATADTAEASMGALEDSPQDKATGNDLLTSEIPAKEDDDFFSSFSSKKKGKKGKKGKKARQSLLEETPDVAIKPAQPEATDPVSDNVNEINPDSPEASIEKDWHEQQIEDQTLRKAVVSTPAEPTDEELPHTETATQELTTSDVAALETPLPEAQATEMPSLDDPVHDAFTMQSGKKRKGKGKKAGRSSVTASFGDSDMPANETADLVRAGEDESAPQSTATTSQEPTEAESEDVWAPTSKGKKAKRSKKLQQLAAMNAQTEAASLESDNPWPGNDTSTSEAQPAAEEDLSAIGSVLTAVNEGQDAEHIAEPDSQPKMEEPQSTTDAGTELETTRDAQDLVAAQEPQLQDNSQTDHTIEQAHSPPAFESLVVDGTPSLESQEPLEQEAVPDLESAFVTSKSKKDKKKDRKARKSAANSWEETETDKPAEKSDNAFEKAGALAGAAASVAAIATFASTETDTAKAQDDVDDWGSFSTKKSKKEKKKARKSGIDTPEVSTVTDAAPQFVESLDHGDTADQPALASETQDGASTGMNIEGTITSPDPQLSNGFELGPDHSASDQAVHETGGRPEAHIQETAAAASAEPIRKVAESDIDFTATVAAGLADSGFDPDMVINDPSFQRRASPTGVAEADPDEAEFAPTTSKKKRKGKKSQQAVETAFDGSSTYQTSQHKSPSDVDDIVNKTLEGTGFDPAILEKAMAASSEQSPAEAEDEFAFTTTKRKKKKKGKEVLPTNDGESASTILIDTPADVADTDNAGALPTLPDDVDAQRLPNQEAAEPDTVLAPTTTTESNEHGWLVQDEMDVDAMDKAYKAYKKNKRQQKKLKAANKSAGLSDNPDSSTLDDTERSAIVSETEVVLQKPSEDAYQTDQSRGVEHMPSSNGQGPVSPSASKSIVDAVFPGLKRIKRRTPAGPREPSSTGDRKSSTETETKGLMHTSEVSQQLPMEVPRTPTSHSEGQALQRSAASQEPSWSFAALQEDRQDLDVSPTRDSNHQVVRDSGYETAKRSSQQTDRSSGEVPAIVRTSSSRDSLRQRRSLEPLRVSTPTSPDWNLQTPKQRSGNDTLPTRSKHGRMPSANTPLEPTSKNRASYLFQSPPDLLAEAASTTPPAFEQPSPSQKSSVTQEHSTGFSSQPEHVVGLDGGRERSTLSPTSPRAPLDAIPEEQARRHHSRKRSKARAEVGGPEHIKAIRRTETPQAIRAQEQALSPSVRHGPSGSTRSVSNPLSTSDEVFNRLPWPAVDQDNDTVNLDRSLSRQPPRSSMTPDCRSASVLSDRSNASASRFKSPQELRSYSRTSDRSSTPSLRRTSLSGDLRAVSRRGGSDLGSLTDSAVGARASPQTIPFEPPPTPPLEHDELLNGSASRAIDMNDDVFQGYGDAQQSQVSPTRPPSVRKRQSMHINELESRLDYLVAENRALQEVRQANEGTRGIDGGSIQETLEARDLQLQAKDAEINQIKAMLQPLQEEVAHLTELSNGLAEANKNLVDDTNGRYGTLQAEHAEAHNQWQATARELESMRSEHGRITSGMRDIVEAEIATALADKNAEILRLREQLDIAAEQIRAFQVQIQGSKASDWLVQRDEDYFDGSCQKLCQHVQQWVLRFSKMSDNRVCRLSTELNNDKIEARLDNAVLDGSDVDKLLGDRVRRRDVFMSVVMTMVWEYVFTRYLFGMDREQRQKLKALEKLLSDVGPPRAVAHWRATTLTLLSKRPSFDSQCALDTEAVAHEIFGVLCMLLPPPAASKDQLQTSLQKVLRIAVDLAIEMRTQRAEYIMLPPLQPEYDTNGDLVRKVYFNASLMNERSGLFSSNEELAAKHSVVKIVLFPLVVKKGDDVGEGDDEIVVCPAQVLVNNDEKRDKKIVRVMSGAMEIDGPIRSRQSNRSLISEAAGSSGF
ncbi:hypothetical protein Slin15195_G096440 [Septoria linicola]|uniref:Involucrin repeat protein n=1 Tax=Septoria linicola TaxID=215465 RepID=A0A9Q9EMR4_9PEZI|nr:hypothetical protein Slin14017_G059530 [Septoria linicola]USW56325.1 hypothetical protein Slin15195_G096440 [Septoria linicola]